VQHLAQHKKKQKNANIRNLRHLTIRTQMHNSSKCEIYRGSESVWEIQLDTAQTSDHVIVLRMSLAILELLTEPILQGNVAVKLQNSRQVVIAVIHH